MAPSKIKINFVGGAWCFVDFDTMHVNGEFTIFDLAGETQMTAITRNVTYCEPMKQPPPESRDPDRGDLFSKRGTKY